MALSPGTRIGPYEVHSLLGAGGMGEVYRARDAKLNRDVAIKVLPGAFAADPDRVARFEREARTLASLNHPHIAAIYGFEERPASLILELVEGDTLAERLLAGALPVDEVLSLARQVAEAVDAAHERGIVHRDLKPANIKVTPDGVVKVLDFGLAKALSAESDSAVVLDPAKSPTVTVEGTRDGVILGTAAYMSPEQARGKVVDRRTDVWAFGCVLFEMLTGRRAFAGDTTSDTIAAILVREPAWSALPPTTPASVRRVMLRCLEKDPRRRMRDIGDVRHELDAREESPSASRPVMPIRVALAAATVTAVVALALWAWFRPAVSVRPEVLLSLSAPDPPRIRFAPAMPPSVSPDGARVATIAVDESGASSVWVRPLNSTVATRLAGTEGASGQTVWSPDGRFIAFFADRKLKKVEASVSGQPVNICAMQANLGVTWGRDDDIVFAPVNRTSLFRVSAAGGTPVAITALDPSRENSHRWPHFLPDGRHFLFTARSDVKANNLIYVGSLDSKQITPLRAAQSDAQYIEPGYLLFADDGALRAQRFDARALTVSGEPFVVAASVSQSTPSSVAYYSASRDGSVIALLPAVRQANRLMWVDRAGKNLGPVGPEKAFAGVRLAPNGKLAAVNIPDPDTGTRDIWIVDLGAGGLTRLTSNPATDWVPVWSPDSTEVAFASDRNGPSSIYRKRADGSGPEDLLLQDHRGVFPRDWTADGRALVYQSDMGSGGSGDLLELPLRGTQASVPLVHTGFQQENGSVSADGKWLAYDSIESGTVEIYVKPYGGSTRTRASAGGGYLPMWRRDGRELYYTAPSGEIMAVPIALNGTPSGPPVSLFTGCGATDAKAFLPSSSGRYDVAADGTKFLLICAPPETVPSAIQVILNWAAPVHSPALAAK